MAINLQALAQKWPSTIVSRDRVEAFTGGLITKGTMANIDSRGQGPPRFSLGPRKVAYPVDSFISWLEKRLADPDRKEPVDPRKRRRDGSFLPSRKRAVDGGAL